LALGAKSSRAERDPFLRLGGVAGTCSIDSFKGRSANGGKMNPAGISDEELSAMETLINSPRPTPSAGGSGGELEQ
jgi:hypothetical protein